MKMEKKRNDIKVDEDKRDLFISIAQNVPELSVIEIRRVVCGWGGGRVGGWLAGWVVGLAGWLAGWLVGANE